MLTNGLGTDPETKKAVHRRCMDKGTSCSVELETQLLIRRTESQDGAALADRTQVLAILGAENGEKILGRRGISREPRGGRTPSELLTPRDEPVVRLRLSTVNRAVCPAAPRVREAQNLRISLLNSLLAGNTAREWFRDCVHHQSTQ